MHSLLVALHVFADTVWIGSIACVALLLSFASRASSTEAPVIATMARRLYATIAQPAFGLAFLGGVGLLSENTRTYMKMHWMHGKLAAVVALIALHHIVGAKAKRAAAGSMQASRNGGTLMGGVLLSALSIVLFVMLRDALVP